MKKQKKTTGTAVKTVIKTILMYVVLTIVLLFAGTRIFGLIINGTPGSTKAQPASVPTSTPAAEVTPSVTPAPTPTSTPSQTSSSILGTITIGSSEINVRSKPSTTAELITTVQPYSTCQVYETTSNEGYTWYRIAENEWVPDAGNWLTYKNN